MTKPEPMREADAEQAVSWLMRLWRWFKAPLPIHEPAPQRAIDNTDKYMG